MAKNKNRFSLFESAMKLADRFFDGFDKFNQLSDKARKENIEMLDEVYPGFKESMDKSAEQFSKLEGKAEKIIFGRDLYLGAGGEARKAEDKRRSLDEQIKDASSRAHKSNSPDKTQDKSKDQER